MPSSSANCAGSSPSDAPRNCKRLLLEVLRANIGLTRTVPAHVVHGRLGSTLIQTSALPPSSFRHTNSPCSFTRWRYRQGKRTLSIDQNQVYPASWLHGELLVYMCLSDCLEEEHTNMLASFKQLPGCRGLILLLSAQLQLVSEKRNPLNLAIPLVISYCHQPSCNGQ